MSWLKDKQGNIVDSTGCSLALVSQRAVTMKDRAQEIHINTLMAVSVVCFLVLSSATIFNSYRIFALKAEIEELRSYVARCSQHNQSEKLYSSTRQRRDILDDQTDNRIHNYDLKGDPSPSQSSQTGQKGDVNKPEVNVTKYSSRQMVEKTSYGSSDSDGYTSNVSSEAEFPIVRDEEVITRKSRARMQLLDERHPRTGRIKPLPSIHLNGDTSSYILGTHDNFNGNGHLRHPHRTFVDWKPSRWVERSGMMTHFEFDRGYLTIKEPGMYFVYAQIYYLDEHDSNGYRVLINNDMILQCTVQMHSGVGIQKGNTCYTAGVEYIAENDRISLEDIFGNHYTVFEQGRSFFGVVKLGDIKIRS
ncbi:uncharacterized protein egr [Euwallacea similis]|uniref:uncharacterized protein egr n=1 Tax=Euwallacea similis TaxID=1736056 RepID=UPI00344DFDE9